MGINMNKDWIKWLHLHLSYQNISLYQGNLQNSLQLQKAYMEIPHRQKPGDVFSVQCTAWYNSFTPEVTITLLELHYKLHKEAQKNIWDEKSSHAMIKCVW